MKTLDSTFQQETMKKSPMCQKPRKTLLRLKSSKKGWKSKRETSSSKNFAASAKDLDAQFSAKESVANPSTRNASKPTIKVLITNFPQLTWTNSDPVTNNGRK